MITSVAVSDLRSLLEKQLQSEPIEAVVGAHHGQELVAESTDVLRVILDGLQRRIEHPLSAKETLRLVGGRE